MQGRLSDRLVGTSAAIGALNAEIAQVARTDARVLITGESGSGKELIARGIVAASLRSTRPFLPVNCAGIPEPLLESELFGYRKGSFTGAFSDHAGKLEMADGGTLFLDEIGEMDPHMQRLLLRFLETGEIQRVGEPRVIKFLDVRVLAATNRDLCEQMACGGFRQDLFYRLNVIHINVPPLRQHREDIPLLVGHFLRTLAGAGKHPRSMSPDAMAVLLDYPWPGNVRELQNMVERVAILCGHDEVQVEDLPIELRGPWHAGRQPGVERRSSEVDSLFNLLVTQHQSFWTAIYPLYMQHEITNDTLLALLDRALGEARGHYKVVLRMFNMAPGDYKRFLNFLTTHHLNLSYKRYRDHIETRDGRPAGGAVPRAAARAGREPLWQ